MTSTYGIRDMSNVITLMVIIWRIVVLFLLIQIDMRNSVQRALNKLLQVDQLISMYIRKIFHRNLLR